MVSIDTDNEYALRNYYLKRTEMLTEDGAHKYALMERLGHLPAASDTLPTQLYKKCAVSGFREDLPPETEKSLSVLLGQAHYIDGTPSPWVSDVWAILGIKWAVEKTENPELETKFRGWINNFLPQRVKDGRLEPYEKAVIDYVSEIAFTPSSAPSIALFFHFQKALIIDDPLLKEKYVAHFLNEFKTTYTVDAPELLLGVMVYVFDKLSHESALVSPNSWSLDDLINFLESIPTGMRRWTWEEKPRTTKGNAVKWQVENEYHVQNLLYLMLAPIFHDVADENYTDPVGQKNPRIDLYLPSMHTIIEVKYRKDSKKPFSSFIGEVAEDASLYRANDKYKNCALIIFLWDHTKATQEHAKFKEGVMKIDGIDGCVTICSPSVMT